MKEIDHPTRPMFEFASDDYQIRVQVYYSWEDPIEEIRRRRDEGIERFKRLEAGG